MTKQMTRRAMLAATAATAMTLAAPASALADEDVLDGDDDVAETDESDTTEGMQHDYHQQMKFNQTVNAGELPVYFLLYVTTVEAKDSSLRFAVENNNKSASLSFCAYVADLEYSYDCVYSDGRTYHFDARSSKDGLLFELSKVPSGSTCLGKCTVAAGKSGELNLMGIPSDLGKITAAPDKDGYDCYCKNRKFIKALCIQAGVTNSMNTSEIMDCADFTYTATWGVTMYRLYNPYSGEHHYTASASERDALVKVGWRNEGVAWNAPTKTGTPVYRLYNPYSGDHHYTTDKDEYEACKKAGWSDEGVGWYSADAKSGAPLYRGFNRFVTIGTHHYTTDGSEMKNMVAHGWRDEGIGWYGLK